MQGVFVFDCVVHAYNMADANLLDRSDAQLEVGADRILWGSKAALILGLNFARLMSVDVPATTRS